MKVKPRGKSATSPPNASSDLRGWPAIAQFLSMPHSTAHRWAKEGMPVRREGRNVVANPEELNQWLQRTSGEAADVHVVAPGSESPLILDTRGNMVRTISLEGAFSYAGVSQNGKRFALQVASFSGMHSLNHERFVIYSVDSVEPIAEVTPDELAEGQSWTAFSPDGSMFVVGSPLKLTLYRLP